jgi:transglutaminase-like putative cysteine protease
MATGARRTRGSTSSTRTGLGLARPDPRHRADGHYSRVGVGRDYADVAPTRGVYTGNAVEELDVSVEIVEL